MADRKAVIVLYSGGKYAEQEPRLKGTVENALGIKPWLEEQGFKVVVTDDKEGPNSVLQKEIHDAEILISTPFHPAYLTKDLLAKAPKLKLAVTAGVGSDHVDLDAANEHKVTVAEVTGSNVVSVAEHVVMSILLLVRNFVPAHETIVGTGDWAVARIARHAYDLEGKVVGTLGAGRIGFRVLQRLKPFDCKELLYYDYTPLPEHAAKEVGARRVESLEEFLGQLDVLTINCPLHEKTINLINKDTLKHLKPKAWVVNTARGAICNAEDIAAALKAGDILGYAGDVWKPQPAPADHPWRSMFHPDSEPNSRVGNGMVMHYSGTTLDAQERYASGTKTIIEQYLTGKEIDRPNVIVEKGDYVSKAYGQRDAKETKTKDVGAQS